MRWNLNSSSPRTIVWPALLPPWKRMTASARSASRSTTLHFPSSPHWAPTTTMPGISSSECRSGGSQIGNGPAQVGAEERQRVAAHLHQPRDRPCADLLRQLVGRQVRRDDDRALVLVARVDDRVQLLEHPLGLALGAEVV